LPSGSDQSFIESLIRFGNKLKLELNSSQQSLFGDTSTDTIVKPEPVVSDEWPLIDKINKEKELIGMYLTAHPLDRFKPEITNLCNSNFYQLNNELNTLVGKDITFVGIVKAFREGISQKNNRPFGNAVLEDFNDTYQLGLWGNDFVNFKNFFTSGIALLFKWNVEEWASKKDGRKGIAIRLKNIYVLSEVRDELIKAVTISAKLEAINEEFINGILKFVNKSEKNKNSKLLQFKIVDEETNIKIDMFSRNQRLELSDQFFDFIQNFEDVGYQLT